MRSLKPFALALGSVFAAVFGAVFFGAQTEAVRSASTEELHHDLPSNGPSTSAALAAHRDGSLDPRTPPPKLHFPTPDFSQGTAFRIAREVVSRRSQGKPARLIDQRRLLLVGIVELRI